MRWDAHQHFWQYDPVEYGWINDKMGILKRDFLPRDLEPLLSAEGFDGSIAVQARQSLEETRWLLELAEQNTIIKGVVGWVDLCSPALDAQLEEFGRNPRLVGLRHVVQDEPDDEFMLRPDFRRGIARLGDYGLKYDVLIYPKHLPSALKLVREFSDQQFVLDHIAKPLIADGVLEPWKSNIRELATCDNITCKLSGMVTEARWQQWHADDFRAYLDTVLEAFGPQRLMIGSDWPVCTLSASYSSTMGLVKNYIAHLSAKEQGAILGGNCAAFYEVD